MIKFFRTLMGRYLSVLSLPMVYKPHNWISIIAIFLMISISFLFTSGLYHLFNQNIISLIVIIALLNTLFLKFNFIIRLFNVLYRSTIYFFRNKEGMRLALYVLRGNPLLIPQPFDPIHLEYNSDWTSKHCLLERSNENLLEFNIIVYYYLYNFVCFILSILLIDRIDYELLNYSKEIGEYGFVYSCFFSIILALVYIDYIAPTKFCYDKNILNKLTKFTYLSAFGLLMVYLLIILVKVGYCASENLFN